MKRLVDIVLIVLTLPVWLPVLLVAGLLVLLCLGRPLFFRQRRSGRNGQPFRILKFRTMTDTRGADGELLPDADRLTACGKFLRSTSLDELPELLNVLRGEMSLVGPRPLPVHYLPRYTAEQSRRLEVRPGITGWAQINGRNQLNWEDRFAHDLWYVDHHSLWLDLKILIGTVLAVFSREGIAAENEATMTEFMGSAGNRDRGPSSCGDGPEHPDPVHKNG